jgi:hypothetical protein
MKQMKILMKQIKTLLLGSGLIPGLASSFAQGKNIEQIRKDWGGTSFGVSASSFSPGMGNGLAEKLIDHISRRSP